MLLTSDSSNPSSSLFALPDTAVAKMSSRQEKMSAMHSAQGGDLGGRRGVQVEDPSSRPSELAEADTQSELSAKVYCTYTFLSGHCSAVLPCLHAPGA